MNLWQPNEGITMEQDSLFDDDDSLYIAKQKWKHTIEGDGGHCPCCGKWGKVYKLKLSQSLALALKWIVDHGDPKSGWVDVQNKGPRWMLKSKIYPLLAHWKLIESGQKRSGIWRATTAGHAFVQGVASAFAAVYIYDNTVWAYDPEVTSFQGCFGKHFDFDELMSTRFDWSSVKLEERRKK